MLKAARTLLDLLPPAEQRVAQLPFDTAERFNWSYVPLVRQGLTLGQMTFEQRRALHDLLYSSLSSTGYLKVTSIIHLEEVLRELERGQNGPIRDPELYYLTFFGTPSEPEIWGWRLEGHHVSLNFATGPSHEIAMTPAFLGANPAEVPSGPHAGHRILGQEEDLARTLLHMLDAEQRTSAIISSDAPGDIITGNDRTARLAHFEGIAAATMTTEQRNVLVRLVQEYTNNLAHDLSQTKFDRIVAAGLDRLHFAWAGSTNRGDGHYYRLHGPVTLIEYDNTQNNANHVHTVWRDFEQDWGGDMLAQHYHDHNHHHADEH